MNPEYSESPKEIYNPCGLYSRLGTTLENMDETVLEHCDGLHFHALCEQDSSALENVLKNFEEKFGIIHTKNEMDKLWRGTSYHS